MNFDLIRKGIGIFILVINFFGVTDWLWRKQGYKQTPADISIMTCLAVLMLYG